MRVPRPSIYGTCRRTVLEEAPFTVFAGYDDNMHHGGIVFEDMLAPYVYLPLTRDAHEFLPLWSLRISASLEPTSAPFEVRDLHTIVMQ